MSKQNNFEHFSILGVEVDALSIKQAVEAIGKLHDEQTGATSKIVVKPYVEFMSRAAQDKTVRDMLNRADLCLPDAVSLQWAASFLYGQPRPKPTVLAWLKSLIFSIQNKAWRSQCIPERMGGVDLTIPLLKMAEAAGWRIGVLGGPHDTAATKAALSKRFARLGVVEVWSGYFAAAEEANLIQTIAAANLDILFVAMGFPRQEEFMFRHRQDKLAKLMIGEGGSFDFDQLGGSLRRAPGWMRNFGLEWLWRLLLQPSRIRRQLAIPHFAWLIFKQARRQSKLR